MMTKERVVCLFILFFVFLLVFSLNSVCAVQPNAQVTTSCSAVSSGSWNGYFDSLSATPIPGNEHPPEAQWIYGSDIKSPHLSVYKSSNGEWNVLIYATLNAIPYFYSYFSSDTLKLQNGILCGQVTINGDCSNPGYGYACTGCTGTNATINFGNCQPQLNVSLTPDFVNDASYKNRDVNYSEIFPPL
jgi:hypothetical protein